jgi:hypothetical protein
MYSRWITFGLGVVLLCEFHGLLKGQSFSPTGYYTGAVQSVSIVAADVNGDGAVDLITANIANNTFTVLTNECHGSFGSNATYLVYSPQDIVAADLNGDGKVDLACASPLGIVVWTNIGAGRFSTPSMYRIGFPHCLRVIDLNCDGAVDIVAGNGSVLTNTGKGKFVLSFSTAFSQDKSLALVDMNGDGLPDWVEAIPNALVVLTNAGNGQFGIMATNNLPTIWPGTICAVDGKHNGRADIFVPFYDSGDGTNILVLTNNGSGFLGSNITYSVPRGPTCVIGGVKVFL